PAVHPHRAAFRIDLHSESIEQRTTFRADEPSGDQKQVAGNLGTALRHRVELAPSVDTDDLHLLGDDGADVSGLVADELDGLPSPGLDDAFLVGDRAPVDPRPLWPRVRRHVPGLGGARVVVELGHADRALPVRGAEAVGGGVTAADDDDPLAGRVDGRSRQVAGPDPVGQRQVVHRLVDAGESAAGHLEVPGVQRSSGEHDGVDSGAQLDDVESALAADVYAGAQLGALGGQLGEPLVDEVLGHLEVGDAVAQQTAEPVRTLVDHDVVAGAGQLLGARESGGAGADDRDPLAGALGGAARTHPALVPGTIDDRQLDLLDRDRVGVDRQDAGRLAGGRAQPAGELREVVRRVQALDGGTP